MQSFPNHCNASFTQKRPFIDYFGYSARASNISVFVSFAVYIVWILVFHMLVKTYQTVSGYGLLPSCCVGQHLAAIRNRQSDKTESQSDNQLSRDTSLVVQNQIPLIHHGNKKSIRASMLIVY